MMVCVQLSENRSRGTSSHNKTVYTTSILLEELISQVEMLGRTLLNFLFQQNRALLIL